jgi:transcriptional regulator with XRE-family HTH domain
MTGEQVKQVLTDNKYQLKDIAEKLGTSLSNLSAGLSKSDIRTGLLEKIAEVSGLPIAAFYGGSFGPVQTAVGDNNTQVAGDYSNAPDSDVLAIMKMKDEQLLLTIRQVSKAQEQMDRVLDRFCGAPGSVDPEGV